MEFIYDDEGQVLGFDVLGPVKGNVGVCDLRDLTWGPNPDFYHMVDGKLIAKSENEVIQLRTEQSWEALQGKYDCTTQQCMYNLTQVLLQNRIHKAVFLTTLPRGIQERIYIHLRELQSYLKIIRSLEYPANIPVPPETQLDISKLSSPNIFRMYDAIY